MSDRLCCVLLEVVGWRARTGSCVPELTGAGDLLSHRTAGVASLPRVPGGFQRPSVRDRVVAGMTIPLRSPRANAPAAASSWAPRGSGEHGTVQTRRPEVPISVNARVIFVAYQLAELGKQLW